MFANLHYPSIPATSQAPDGLSRKLASTLHLIDALTGMQLTASGQPASCMPLLKHVIVHAIVRRPCVRSASEWSCGLVGLSTVRRCCE